MVYPAAQPPSLADGAHLVLFDDACGFCSRLVRFVLQHDRRGVFSFSSLQSPVGRSIVERAGGNPGELASFYVVARYRTPASARAFTRSDAALFVAGALGWPWRAAQIMRVVPLAIRDRIYDVVARSRHRVFGRRARCVVPRSDFRNRLIDGQAGEL